MKKYTEEDYVAYLEKEVREFKEELSENIASTDNELQQDDYQREFENSIYMLFLNAYQRNVSKENLERVFSEFSFYSIENDEWWINGEE